MKLGWQIDLETQLQQHADICIVSVHPAIKAMIILMVIVQRNKVLKQDLGNKHLTTRATKLAWLFPLRDLLDVSLEIPADFWELPADIFGVFFLGWCGLEFVKPMSRLRWILWTWTLTHEVFPPIFLPAIWSLSRVRPSSFISSDT